MPSPSSAPSPAHSALSWSSAARSSTQPPSEPNHHVKTQKAHADRPRRPRIGNPCGPRHLIWCNAASRRDIGHVMDDSEGQFRVMFESTYAALARYARHRGLSGVDAEDLVAGTYEVAWRRMDVVPTGDGTLPW